MKRRGNVISPIDTISTLSEMLVGTDFTVEDGEQVYVRQTQQWFVYRVNSGLVPDGATVIQPAYGNGVWELLNIGPSGTGGLGPFNTVALGLAGSGRLLDVTATQLGLLKRGTVAWVESVKDFWRWDPTSTLTADNITVCNPTANGVNPGRFIRELVAAPEWMAQATWFVDAGTGNDENTGLTSLVALRTDTERQRRWGRQSTVTVAMTVTYLAALGGTDQANFNCQIMAGAGLTLQGTRAPTTVSALTAVTTLNRASQTPWDVTGVGLGAGDVGNMIRITAGPRAGNYARVMKDLGGGRVRTTPWGTASFAAVPFAQVTPVAGDAVQVYTMTVLNVGTLRFVQGSSRAVGGSPVVDGVLIDSLVLNGTTGLGSIDVSGTSVVYSDCILRDVVLSGGSGNHLMGGGGVENSVLDGPGSITLMAFGCTTALDVMSAGPNTVLDGDCLFQAASLRIGAGAGVSGGLVSIFDVPGADTSLIVRAGGQYRSLPFASTDLLWGTANAGHGAAVQAFGGLLYTTKPTINGTLGPAREVLVGGTDQLWVGVPFFDSGAAASGAIVTSIPGPGGISMDPTSLDAFGRLRVSEPFTLFDSKQLLSNQPLFWDDQQTAGAGTTSTYIANQAASRLDVTANVAGTRMRQTFQRFNYQPGKGQLLYMTGVLVAEAVGTGITGVTRRIGYFDSSDGLFFQRSGTITSIVVRSSTSGAPVDTTIVQASWNLDKLDGTGPSQITLDITKTQIFVIDFQWLGVGRVRFGFDIGGVVIYCHEVLNANTTLVVPYMRFPNLPFRYEISSAGTGPATTGSLLHICTSVISEGGFESTGLNLSVDRGAASVSTANDTNIYSVLALRFQAGVANRTATINDVVYSVMTPTANSTFRTGLLFNPTIAAPALVWTPVPNSALEVALPVAGNLITAGTGTLITSSYDAQNRSSPAMAQPTDLRLGTTIAGVSDILVLFTQPTPANGVIVLFGSMSWREQV